MDRVRTIIADWREIEIPSCPYCGEKPKTMTKIEKRLGAESIETTFVCPHCKLSAPIQVWLEIAERVPVKFSVLGNKAETP